ncbi:MAG: ABC transporter substrate-binding protein [Moraxella sp.]|nr:ABC transporter substrate-binding protein [Moraxella sp.]
MQVALKGVLLKKMGVGLTLMSAVSVALVGCTNNQETATAKADGSLETLVIALDWVPNTNHTGLYVALDQGYFKQAGFDAKIVQPSEDSTSTLVSTKRADFGVYFQPNMVKRLNKGEPITAVAAITQTNSAGLLSLKSLGANSAADLKGKRYSTWEDPVDDATVASLVGTPLNPIPGEATDAATALRMNQFDYILAYYSWDGVHAGLKGVETNFFYLKDANPVFDYYSPILIANSDSLAQNPERYKKALSAIHDGYVFAAKNPAEAADILIKHVPEMNAELAKQSQAYISPTYLASDGSWGRFDYARWDRFFTWVSEQKLVEAAFAPQAGVTNDYLPQ